MPTVPAALPPAEIQIPGFEVELKEIVTGQPQRVVMEPIPDVFENHPAAVTFATTSTGEGNMADSALAEAVGATFPVRNLGLRPLGDWLAYAIRNDENAWVATRLAMPREGPGLPALLALEAASASTAQPVRISGPDERHADISSGIVFYPPLEVKVRGQPGIYLHQEVERVEPLPSTLPVCTLIWREGDVYWRISGICATSPQGQYDLFSLLDMVNYMYQYDPESGRWVRLDGG
ncbi:MAG: hypothetical protein MUP62_04695 [Dehalococcoidia bacterium]|nr:hypothetical protein [Dehalococcoidia bacterium]